MSVPIGTSRAQVVAKYGPGLLTGTKNDMIHGIRWERYGYRSGNKGVGVEFTQGKVSRVEDRPNLAPEWAKKVQTGMTMEQVLKVLGPPASGYSDKNPFPDQMWTYADSVAPIQALMVQFRNRVVSSAKAMNNDAMR